MPFTDSEYTSVLSDHWKTMLGIVMSQSLRIRQCISIGFCYDSCKVLVALGLGFSSDGLNLNFVVYFIWSQE